MDAKQHDLSDWIADGPAEVIAQTQSPLEILSYEQMRSLPPVEWLVNGLLPARASSLIFGESNSYKSFLAVDIACSVATGTPWHGHGVKSGKVVYVATEGAIGVGSRRIPGWMDFHGVDMERTENIHLVMADVTIRTKGTTTDLIASICRRVQDKLALIVFDVLAPTLDGADSDGEAVADWQRNCQRIIHELGCSLLWVTHTGWSDRTRARGHTALWGGFDTRLRADGDASYLATELTVERHKDAEGGQAWAFRLDQHRFDDGNASTLIPIHDSDVQVQRQRTLGPVQRVVVDAFDEVQIRGGGVRLPLSLGAVGSPDAVRWDDLLDEFRRRVPRPDGRDRRSEQLTRTVRGLDGYTFRDGFVWRAARG